MEIKVIGQRFLSAIDWPDEVHIRTAGHEILHPPLDKNGRAFTAALTILDRDELISRIVKEHNSKIAVTMPSRGFWRRTSFPRSTSSLRSALASRAMPVNAGTMWTTECTFCPRLFMD